MPPHPAFAVEALRERHLREAAELEALCFSEPWSAQALALLTTDAAVGFAALQNGRLIAYGGMLLAPDEGQITNIAVHPDFRRLGAGNAILAALLCEAERRSLPQIALEVRASNAAAISLYQKAGFEVCGERKHFYRKPTENALVMIKRTEQARSENG